MKENHCNKRESRLGCWKILLVAILFPALFLFMQTVASAASLTLTQDSEVSLPETGVTLTAKLVDDNGAVMIDKWVTFVVTAGPNAWAFFPEDRKTNDKGEATFKYFGGDAPLGSTDTIEASVNSLNIVKTIDHTWDAVPLEAAFSSSVTSGEAPLEVHFVDQSTGATIWEWDFGDGNTSNEQNPIHTYAESGTYTVSLTVWGSPESDTETKQDYITVISEDPAVPSVLELRTRTFHSHGFGKRVCVRLKVKNIGDEKLSKIKVVMFKDDGNGRVKVKERTFHRRLKPNRTANVWLRHYSREESLSGSHLIFEVSPMRGKCKSNRYAADAEIDGKVEVKILVP